MSEPASAPEHWNAAYRERPGDQSSWWQDADGLWLDLLDLAGATGSAHVLDVGAGASLVVDSLVRRGIGHVTVLDLSEEAFALVRARLGESEAVSYVVGDVRSFVARPQVDVWHDRAVLHFLVDEADREAYRASLLASVQIGGHAVIAVFAEDGPEQCSGLPVRRASAADLASFLGEEFEVTYTDRRVHTTPWDSTQPFTVVVAKRRN